jgi:gliding motility-associated-like protein
VEYNHRELDFDNPVLLFTDCSEGRHHTVWTFDDGQTFTGSKLRRQFRHPLPDSVIVTMTSCNQYDCCADTTFGLPMRIRSVWFPNIFTPDGESNNLFGCYTSFDVEEFRMVIYNRWGIELWSTEDINTQWDGRRYDGTPCPQGAYVYRYWITSPDGTFKSGIGTITLIR